MNFENIHLPILCIITLLNNKVISSLPQLFLQRCKDTKFDYKRCMRNLYTCSVFFFFFLACSSIRLQAPETISYISEEKYDFNSFLMLTH